MTNEIDQIHALKELKKELELEAKKIFDTIKTNEDKIKEVDIFLKELYAKESNEYKYFSPRNIESIYKDRIEQEKVKKLNFENENHSHLEKYQFLLSIIRKIDIKKDINDLKVSDYVNNQEKENKIIASELHDTYLQDLICIKQRLFLIEKCIEQDSIRASEEIKISNQIIQSSIDNMRNLIYNIRPMVIDDLDFIDSMEQLKNEILQKLDKDIKLEFNYIDIEKISIEQKTSIYRIIKELCTNAIKHSECTKLIVKIYRMDSNNINIDIVDDGKGFASQTNNSFKKFGLLITEERVKTLSGSINILSSNKEGTSIHIILPIAE